MKHLGLLFFALFLLAQGISAQTEPPYQWTASSKQKSAKAGEIIVVKVTAQINDGWHIYSTKSYGDDGPLPTSFAPPLAMTT